MPPRRVMSRPLFSMTPEALAALHGSVFDRGWSAAEFAAFCNDPACVLITAQHGFALARVVLDEAEILTIVTDPDHQGQGIGRAILSSLWATLAARGVALVFLEVADDNQPARALYDRAGFTRIGLRKGYYPRRDGPPADALILRKALP